jgi:hypothetical protein
MLSTILAFFTFAAGEAGHEETSKTLFYVVGGAAAAYGVLIAFFGLTKHDFPSSDGGARAVYALSTLVVAAAMVSSVLTG